MDAAEKTYQTYFVTARNRGGHSSRPRPDNAIYDLADALKKIQAHRFTPMLNDVSRAYFTERAKDEKGALGDAMRRWLANPNDGAAADVIEYNELEVGKTRTRCVATMLEGGHADNALPQSARGDGQLPDHAGRAAGLGSGGAPARWSASNVEVVPDPSFIGKPTPIPPIRPDVLAAYTKAVQQLHGPGMRVIPNMTTGTTDANFFRSVGIPVYGVDGGWLHLARRRAGARSGRANPGARRLRRPAPLGDDDPRLGGLTTLYCTWADAASACSPRLLIAHRRPPLLGDFVSSASFLAARSSRTSEIRLIAIPLSSATPVRVR